MRASRRSSARGLLLSSKGEEVGFERTQSTPTVRNFRFLIHGHLAEGLWRQNMIHERAYKNQAKKKRIEKRLRSTG